MTQQPVPVGKHHGQEQCIDGDGGLQAGEGPQRPSHPPGEAQAQQTAGAEPRHERRDGDHCAEDADAELQ